jgi:hypothetical protein
LTFQGHARSKVTTPNETPYILSYSCLIVTIALGSTITQIQSILLMYTDAMATTQVQGHETPQIIEISLSFEKTSLK